MIQVWRGTLRGSLLKNPADSIAQRTRNSQL